MVAWSVQLFEFDISYKSRGHAFANFITEMVASGSVIEENRGWLLSINGASNQSGSGVGVILEGPNGVLVEQSLHSEFKTSNNQAEYKVLLTGMRLAKELEAKTMTAKSDLKLVTGQVNGEYQAKDPQLIKYLKRETGMVATFKKFTLHHVPREPNERADLLLKLTTTHKRGVQLSVIHKSISRSTIKESTIYSMEERRMWMSLLMEYLKDELLPTDTIEARKVARDAARYIIIGGELYRWGFSFSLLWCIKGKEARYLIMEMHEGVCDTHIGGRALASKIARAGYYWLTLKNDCMEYVGRCDRSEHNTLEQLHSITSPWSFHKCGVDILGSFSPTLGQVKYLIMAVDYFTKWIEAEPVATISIERVKHFY
ncbi:rnhA, partial [Mucuna pruriens]